MRRFPRIRSLAMVLALAAAGCQDYNFNPVGHCLIQPGSQNITLSSVSTADVLFVVDDSNSMAGKQANLAAAFNDFVENLTSTNLARAQSGLLPLDFHIATTTTSVFYNPQALTNQICSSGCAGVPSGQLACCVGSVPVYGPKKCDPSASPSQCTVAGTACSDTCSGLLGDFYCCSPTGGTFPPGALNELVTCSVEGIPCGQLDTHFNFAGCVGAPGWQEDGLPFPDGNFVGSTSVTPAVANPRVLHFDKRLYYTGTNAQGFTIPQLVTFFRQNVAVGTCGSAEEQGLIASRHAVEKALAGHQRDTWTYDPAAGKSATGAISGVAAFSAPNGIPTPGATAAWPNPNSKLVVVYVGDEDDCSSPPDPSGGVVLLNSDVSGADACVRDSDPSTPAPLGGKEYPVSSFVNYFTGLGREVGAAFVVDARSNSDASSCSNATCVTNLGDCCDQVSPGCQTSTCPPTSGGVCGGQAPGVRFLQAASGLQAKGADVVVGSVCSDFESTLQSVAEIVKPPQTLSLSTLPADGRITILRIATSTGETRKICGRPLAPAQALPYTQKAAQATGADWWFTATVNPGPPFDPTGSGTTTVAVPTQFVYINPNGSCIANPGETYSADYLGIVPAEGCTPMPQDVVGGSVAGSADCQAKLGGQFGDWQCFVPPGLTTGTCSCRGSGG